MAGLLDFLQSASNSVAGNVSGPVDLLTLALRKLGIPVPEDSVGSSPWMQRQGLTRPVQQSATSLAGETAGLLAPIAAAAKAPQIARGLLQGGENLAARRTLNPQTGAIVWHGSPHKFDAFDASKIGTGEGEQAYAHGLYTGGAKETGVTYQNTLGRTDFVYSDQAAQSRMKEMTNFDDRVWTTIDMIAKRHQAEPKATATALREYAAKYSSGRAAIKEAADLIDAGRMTPTTAGYLYKVDLPDEHIAKMLDWDKPLSQQAPEVRKALNAMGYKPDAPDVTGSQVLMDLAFKHGDEAKAAEALRNAGVHGTRYLDGVSRGSGEGSRNYVVFPGMEHILKILERNGIPIR